VFQPSIDDLKISEAFNQEIYLDYGLHARPGDLKIALQEKIDAQETPSIIFLVYGLCGNGLDGLSAGKHILLVPRVDDCIALTMGSYQIYREHFEQMPGTYYLSRGWLEAATNPLDEFRNYQAEYDESTAQWLMDQQFRNYKRLAYVSSPGEDMKYVVNQVNEIADFCSQWGMRYERIRGSNEYIHQFLKLGTNFSNLNGNFILVAPGGVLTQKQFLRE
jgi:hypothetical protein